MLRELVIDWRQTWRDCTPIERVILVLCSPVYVPVYILAAVLVG